MKVHKKISKYNNSARGEIRYIVIHYIGAVSSAKNNAIYFAGGDRQASAHYYVDHEIWQGTKLSRASWHCGGEKRGTSGGKLFSQVLWFWNTQEAERKANYEWHNLYDNRLTSVI